MADYEAIRAEAESFPAAIEAVETLAGQLRAECPGVLANEPQPAQGASPSISETLIEEEEGAGALGAAARTESQRHRSFLRAVSPLHWSNRVLTRLVHSDAAAEVAVAQLPSPNLCADSSAWVSSGYQTVTADTESYVRRESGLSAATDGAERAIMSELTRYEDQSDKHIVGKIAKLEKTALPADVVKLVAALGRVAEALRTTAAAPAT